MHCETRPATTASYKSNIDEKANWEKIVSHSNGNGCSYEAEFELLITKRESGISYFGPKTQAKRGIWNREKQVCHEKPRLTQTKNQFIKAFKGAKNKRT